jgi:hypothetical protein
MRSSVAHSLLSDEALHYGVLQLCLTHSHSLCACLLCVSLVTDDEVRCCMCQASTVSSLFPPPQDVLFATSIQVEIMFQRMTPFYISLHECAQQEQQDSSRLLAKMNQGTLQWKISVGARDCRWRSRSTIS